MYRDLIIIPEELFGFPVFGFGILLFLWVLFSIVLLLWLVRRQGFDADTRGYIPVLLLVAAAIAFVTPLLVEAERGLPIRSYGVMMLIGVVGGVALAAWRSRHTPIDLDHVFSLAFWMFIGGIVGARLFHVIEYWNRNYRQPREGDLDLLATLGEIVNVPKGGLVVYGSLIGGLAVLPLFAKKYKQPGLVLCDLIAPTLVLGLAFGRIGCLLNGCCFGGPCELPWAVTFPEGSPPHLRQMEKGLEFGIQIGGRPDGVPVVEWVSVNSPLDKQGLKVGDHVIKLDSRQNVTTSEVWEVIQKKVGSVVSIRIGTRENPQKVYELTMVLRRVWWGSSLPVHPTQVYSAINAALLCLFLLAYHPFCRRDGQLFAVFLTIYPVARFLLEIIRTDEASMFGTGLSISQLVSIGILCGAAVLWWRVLRQPARPDPGPPEAASA